MIQPENRFLYIWGTAGQSGSLEYEFHLRGGMSWKTIDSFDASVDLKCRKARGCESFLAAKVEPLTEEMYDIAIHVKSEPIKDLEFHISFVDSDYTQSQIFTRAIYCAISLVVFMMFATKILCRIPDGEARRSITQEQV